MNTLCTLIIAFLGTACASKVRYDGYKLYRINSVLGAQLETLGRIANNSQYGFWSDADLLVPPKLRSEFLSYGFNTTVLMEDVQKTIDEQEKNAMAYAGGNFGWKKYHTLEEIEIWLIGLEEAYPGIVKVFNAGMSYEGRHILGVHISYGCQNANKGVFIEGGIHAREWLNPAVVTYFINQLLTDGSVDMRSLAESYDWYIVPIFNPDGYSYSFTSDRLWRKNRRIVKGSVCNGVDLNRNFAEHWTSSGVNGIVCSPNYSGDKPFSEIETLSTAQYIDSINKKLIGHLTFHSYGQYLLIPYANGARVENHDELYEIGSAAIKSLKKRYGTEYTLGNYAETMYTAKGVSTDWVKTKYEHIKLVFSYELRDKGSNGFLMPAKLIVPTAKETIDSLITMFEYFEKIYGSDYKI